MKFPADLFTPPFLALLWLFILNVVTFVTYGADKWKAKHKRRRISERTLLVLAALGGSVGALLGMRAFRHKTLHKRFTIGIPSILGIQCVLFVVGMYSWKILL